MTREEAFQYTQLVWAAIERNAENLRRGGEAKARRSERLNFKKEVRARYVAAQNGDVDAYMKEACQVFDTNWPSAVILTSFLRERRPLLRVIEGGKT
jgi:hypothetical protein